MIYSISFLCRRAATPIVAKWLNVHFVDSGCDSAATTIVAVMACALCCLVLQELEFLQQRLDLVTSNNCQIVVIESEALLGKSRLMRQFIDRLPPTYGRLYLINGRPQGTAAALLFSHWLT